MSEEDKLGQEDQRIKVMELDKLEDLNEGNSSFARGDWVHRINPAISSLCKSITVLEDCGKDVERKVQEAFGTKSTRKDSRGFQR